MAAAGRKRDVAVRVMVTAKEQAEIRKAANKAAMPMSVFDHSGG
jgi:formylmethanofuran:tetrahydromethanopterin formyltransferase